VSRSDSDCSPRQRRIPAADTEAAPVRAAQQISPRSRPAYAAPQTGQLNVDLNHFAARVLQDALTEAIATYWERRAQQWAAAAPCKDDYQGRASLTELLEAWERCQEVARACRRHAALLRSMAPEGISDEVWDAIEEAAR
jgi:hypothetical protein